jgi:hypothetical protein
MSIHFAEAFNQLIRERRLDREVLMDTLTRALSAVRQHGRASEDRRRRHGFTELFLVKRRRHRRR